MDIFILDANDNAPEFMQSSYLAQITSNVTNGFPVIKLSAKDADEGENARISYKFLEVTFFKRIIQCFFYSFFSLKKKN